MSFKITSDLKPNTFVETSDCAISCATFEELIDAHYTNKIPERGTEARKTLVERLCEAVYRIIDLYIGELAPYFVALIEDESEHCALYDLKGIYAWFKTGSVTNPKSKATVTRVHILGITRAFDVTQLMNFETVDILKVRRFGAFTVNGFKAASGLIETFEKSSISSELCDFPDAIVTHGEEVALNWLNLLCQKSCPTFTQPLLDIFKTKTLYETDKLLQENNSLNFYPELHEKVYAFCVDHHVHDPYQERAIYHLERLSELQHGQGRDFHFELTILKCVQEALMQVPLRQATHSGGGHYEPVSDETYSIVDGHLMLSSNLADYVSCKDHYDPFGLGD